MTEEEREEEIKKVLGTLSDEKILILYENTYSLQYALRELVGERKLK